MRAAICQDSEFKVGDVPEPILERGQVRLEVSHCGICGSDLHCRHGMSAMADVAMETGYERLGRSEDPVVFGHEFSGTVAEYGPRTKAAIPAGSPVVALPLLRTGDLIDPIGLSLHSPGAYAEQVVVQESLMIPVPDGLPLDVAALTEPMAIAWHAVRRGDVGKKQVAIVIGCGPIGLGVILMLKASGVRTVVASDFSPGRRKLAEACGADVVIDPAVDSPYDAAGSDDHLNTVPEAVELLVGSHEKIRRLPTGWWQAWRLVDKLGIEPKYPVIFECVGVPGVIEDIVAGAPMLSRVVVAGVCLAPDTFRPGVAVNKEIDVRFVIGYNPLEFRDTLHMLAEGKVDPRPLMTGVVGLDGVEAAFDSLGDPEVHAKILIDPRSELTEPSK